MTNIATVIILITLLKLVTTLLKISAIFSAHGSNRHDNPVHSLRYAEWRRGSRSWTVTIKAGTTSFRERRDMSFSLSLIL